MLCSTGQFKCSAFISHYIQLKIIAKLSHRNVVLKGWDFSWQLTTRFLYLCVFISSVLWFMCLMFCCTIPTKPGKNAFALRDNTKWLSTLNFFFSPNICLTFCSLPEQRDTSSISIKWPRLNKLIPALAIPSWSHRDFWSEEEPLVYTLLSSKFFGSRTLAPNIFCIFIHLWCHSCTGHQSSCFYGF